MKKRLLNITEICKYYFSTVLKDGDIVIDATVGNGNDTLFLSEKVGPSGRVYAFDIQSAAIMKTKEVLQKYDLLDRVILINESHEYISNKVKDKIKGAMFNLGYLPGGDHTIITKSESTGIAIKQCIDILHIGGLITICIYTGHNGGKEEAIYIENLLKDLDSREYDVVKLNYTNKRNNPPYLIMINKIK